MLKNSKAVTLICSGIGLITTIVVYLLVLDNIFTVPIYWISLLMLIIAEAIGTVKALNVKKDIWGVAGIITSLIHICLVLLLSIVFVNLFPMLIKAYVLLNLLILCILSIIDVLILYFAGYIRFSNKKLVETQTLINSCYSKAQSLYIEYSNTEYKADLSEIVEMLRYSDNSALTNDENNILNCLEELKKLLSDSEQATEKISEIKNLIRLRSSKMISQKRGSF